MTFGMKTHQDASRSLILLYVLSVSLITTLTLSCTKPGASKVERVKVAMKQGGFSCMATKPLPGGLGLLAKDLSPQASHYLKCTKAKEEIEIHLYTFKDGTAAIKAGTKLGLRTWPQGWARMNYTSGVTAVELYCRRANKGLLESVQSLITGTL